MWPWTILAQMNAKLDKILKTQSDIKDALGGLGILVGMIITQGKQTMAQLNDLETQVAATLGAEQSAIVLIQGLADALKAAGTDPVKLAALVKQLSDSKDALAAAVAANPLPV